MLNVKTTTQTINIIIKVLKDTGIDFTHTFISGDIVPFVYNELATLPTEIEICSDSLEEMKKCKGALKDISKILYRNKLIINSTVKESYRFLLKNHYDLTVKFVQTISAHEQCSISSNLINEVNMETLNSYLLHLVEVNSYDKMINAVLSMDTLPDVNLGFLTERYNTMKLSSSKSLPLIITTTGLALKGNILAIACIDYFEKNCH